jgi:hypothetical protein
MRKKGIIIFVLTLVAILNSCKKDNDGIPEKTPDILDGNWVVFETRVSDIGELIEAPFDLVTAVDPNNDSLLVIDNLYSSGLRVKAIIDTTSFEVHKGEQLEKINARDKDIVSISLRGYVSTESVLVNTIYSLAASYYEHISFEASDIEDVIFIRAGYYDEYDDRLDTVMILGYRKTGFEDESY